MIRRAARRRKSRVADPAALCYVDGGVREMNPSSWFGAGADSRLQVLWDDGERVFCRRSREAGDGDAMLAVVPASDPPTPRSLDRLAHEFGLKDELGVSWGHRRLPYLRGPPLPRRTSC